MVVYSKLAKLMSIGMGNSHSKLHEILTLGKVGNRDYWKKRRKRQNGQDIFLNS